MENLQIKFDSDVRSFFYWLMVEMELGASFHPDTPFEDYDKQNEDYPDEIHSVFNPEFASLLQERLTECFEVCEHSGLDIYEIGLQMAQRLGFSPRPDDSEAIKKATEEVNAHITRDKRIIFRDTPFPNGHLTSVEKTHCYLMECSNFVEVYIKKP